MWVSFGKRNEMQVFSFSFSSSSCKMLGAPVGAGHRKTRCRHTAKTYSRLIPVSWRGWVLPSEEGAGDLP